MRVTINLFILQRRKDKLELWLLGRCGCYEGREKAETELYVDPGASGAHNKDHDIQPDLLSSALTASHSWFLWLSYFCLCN